MSLSIVLPCYNPPEQWPQNIVNHYNEIRNRIEGPIEVILVEDGISNNVKEDDIQFLKANISDFHFIQYPVNRGKGYALRQGANVAKNDLIIYTDIDFPYTLGSLYSVYDALNNNNCDIAVGIKNDTYYKGVPFIRRVISKSLKWLISTFLSMPITDTQCGLKGFRRNALPLFLKTTIDRYLFDLEFIRNGYKEKYKIIPIPITLNEGVHFRHINYRILLPEMRNFLTLLFK